MTLWTVITDGAFLLIPLAVIFIACVIIFIIRCVKISKSYGKDSTFMHRIRDYVAEGDTENALQLCKASATPQGRIISRGLSRIGRPAAEIKEAMETAGNLETARLGSGLMWLATSAAAAPLLGFIGTVIGMAHIFYSADKVSAPDWNLLAPGVFQALITTVAGLGTGLLALFAYNGLGGMINRATTSFEEDIIEFLDLLNEPAS